MKINLKKVFAIFIILMILATLLIFISCKKDTQTVGAAASQNADSDTEKIVISGLGEDKEISIEELKKIEPITTVAATINSSNEKSSQKVKGILLEDVLKKYFNKSQKDLSAIVFYAGDGYSVEIPKEILNSRDIILAYELDGRPLDSESKPLRVTVPDERSLYWVKNLIKIEIIENRAEVELNKIVFLDTAASSIELQDFDYYGVKDKAVKTEELLAEFSQGTLPDAVRIESSDGLKKVEELDSFKKALIKITGEDAPAFLADDLPKGMWVKNIIKFSYGPTVYFSIDEALATFENTQINDLMGASIKDVIEKAGLTEAKSYLFTASDGYNTEIKSTDIEKGLIYLNEKGELETYFKDLPKNSSVKNLLSIEIVKSQ
jgi:DMSO/TMAO reductase YedYZ molybdopterin-dependent catalytic subunit